MILIEGFLRQRWYNRLWLRWIYWEDRRRAHLNYENRSIGCNCWHIKSPSWSENWLKLKKSSTKSIRTRLAKWTGRCFCKTLSTSASFFTLAAALQLASKSLTSMETARFFLKTFPILFQLTEVNKFKSLRASTLISPRPPWWSEVVYRSSMHVKVLKHLKI